MTHSSGADPVYVARLAAWAAADPDRVRRHIDRLIRRNSTPALLNMDDTEFWAHARHRIRLHLEKGLT